MKIAITSDPEIAVPPLFYGGIERIIDMLIIELMEMGHEVTLFANNESKVNCQLKSYQTKGNSFKDIINNSSLITKTVKAQKFDVIHSFGRLAYLLPLMPSRIPKLMSYQREPTLKQIKRAVLFSSKNSMHFTGCSDYISNQIKPFAPASTVYNGVDFAKYSPSLEIPNDAPFIFLGRIELIKGVHVAIDIALKSKRKLIIAGNVPDYSIPYFDEKIKPFLGDQISYVGAVNDLQKNELFGKSAALLMPILWNEPFGIVMVEAMACGTPVLGLSRGAVPEVVENGKTGFHSDVVDELIAKVPEILLLNRKNVVETAKARFSSQEITNQYVKQYQQF